MPYVVPPTFTAGSVLTASQMNTISSDIVDHESRINDTGLVIVTPTSVTGSGVAVSNGAVTLTSAATATINGVFTATYDNYRVVWTLSGSGAANDTLNLRLTASGTPNSTSGAYYYAATGLTSGSVANNTASSTTGSAFDFFNIGSTGTGQCPGFADILNPFVAQRTGIVGGFGAFSTATLFVMRTGVGQMNVTTSYDGLVFTPTTGGITMTGTIRVYGYQNS